MPIHELNVFPREIHALLTQFAVAALGATDEKLLQLRREENAELTKLLARHKRSLDWLAGEKIEPMAHEATCVLFAAGDFNAA